MSVRYEIIDSEFEQLLDTSCFPQVISQNHKWTEGPVWLDNALYFNDIPNKKMFKWSQNLGAQQVIGDTDFANGNTTDLQGNMISCEHGKRRVIRRLKIEDENAIEIVADSFKGKRLNSPNDVIVKSDGTVWFSDPPYGINSDVEGYLAKSEIGGCFVFRVDIDGTISAVATDFEKPNGLAFSPNEKQLYIADSGAIKGASFPEIDYKLPHHIKVFNVDELNNLSEPRLLVEIYPGVPDGLRVDTEGYIWSSALDGIHCLQPNGNIIGKIRLPEQTSNCCFGGRDGNDLFITSSTRVYRVKTNRKGAESLFRKF